MRALSAPRLGVGLAMAVGASLLLGTGAQAAETAAPAAGTADTAPQAPIDPATAPRGLIVKTIDSGVSALGVAAASETALSAVGEPAIDVSIGSAIAPSTRVFLFDQPVDEAQAEAAARELESRPDVLWAVPDRPVHLTVDQPRASVVLPDDPRFDEQWDVWDQNRSGGGYSVKAPTVWDQTTGSSSVVVAIVDTGITSHPDLNANVVAGYDFISDVAVANDGNARDADPADPGDWITNAESSGGDFDGCDVTDSSWHGTHVAGTIAAVQDNGIGISGVAPGVRIQAVRALGKCGGYTSDIAAAIRWAVGGSVSGVPANKTPAKVVNVSLGGAGDCSAAEQEAVDFVRSQGAVIVVAAGNEAQPVSTSSPANCDGVIAVAATRRDGGMSSYSNYGKTSGEVTIAAPGGDTYSDTAILSTINTGTRSPSSPAYGNYQGTSMATPHVAAGAALLYSLGFTGTSAVTNALKAAVQSFPTGVDSPCTVTKCGVGILDLSKVTGVTPPSAPGAPTSVTATAGDGSITASWTAPTSTGGSAISTYTATASPGGQSCITSSTSCAITGLTNGTTYTVTVTATNADGETSSASASASATPAATVTATPGAVTNVRVQWRPVGATYTAIVRWSAPSGATGIDGYRARLAKVGGTYGAWTSLDSPSVRATALRVGATYRLQIQAHNASGYGTSYVVRLRP